MRHAISIILSLIVLSSAPFIFAADPKPPHDADDWRRMKPIVPRGYVCQRASTPINVDGKLDDAAWKDAAWSDDFVDIEGPAKPAPRYRTRMKMLWDDEFFYIAAEILDPHVWGNITKKN